MGHRLLKAVILFIKNIMFTGNLPITFCERESGFLYRYIMNIMNIMNKLKEEGYFVVNRVSLLFRGGKVAAALRAYLS